MPDGAQDVASDLGENETNVRELFANCQDVQIRRLHAGQKDAGVDFLIVYGEGLVDMRRVNREILPSLEWVLETGTPSGTLLSGTLLDHLQSEWMVASLTVEQTLQSAVGRVFSGHLVLFVDHLAAAIVVDVGRMPGRTPEDPNTETSITGARDGFVEVLTTNIALVRKRLRTSSLACEKFVIGRRTQTEVALLYLADVLQPGIHQEVRRRLLRIDVDGVTAAQQLSDLMSERPFFPLPLFAVTGRPDYAASSLLHGRFILLLAGSPVALQGPVTLSYLLQSAEDDGSAYIWATFKRVIRLVALLVSLLLPAFYVAMTTYHQEQIPLAFLSMVVEARRGNPLPSPMEAFVMLTLFEVFKEAGMRLPSAVGQTLAVVGGLIIGDAAIEAGLTSASLLVVVSTTAIMSYTLGNSEFTALLSVLRLCILVVASFLGLYGLLLASFGLLVCLANMRSFGVPYLSPVSPFAGYDFLHVLLRWPLPGHRKRATTLHPRDEDRQVS